MGRNTIDETIIFGMGDCLSKSQQRSNQTDQTNKPQEDGVAIFRLSKRNDSEKERLEELRTHFHLCIQQRKILESTGTIYRLIHGGNDISAGIRIDRFGSEFCCTYATEGLSKLHDEISC